MKQFVIAPSILMLVASCSSGGESWKCPQPKQIILSATPSLDELEGSVRACIHMEAYHLAAAPGTNEAVADSVMHGCNGSIAVWRSRIENSDGEYAVAAIGDAYFGPKEVEFRKDAVFRVAEARAGKCSLK